MIIYHVSLTKYRVIMPILNLTPCRSIPVTDYDSFEILLSQKRN